MNAISTPRSISPSAAVAPAPAAAPTLIIAAPVLIIAAPAAAVTLSPQAQKALLSAQPQAGNIPWGSGPNR